MKLVTTDEMRSLEQTANGAGLDYGMMMERAGHATALAVKERVGARLAHCLVLVGPGNNGGDGLVAAYYLHTWGYKVAIYIWKRTQQEDDPNLKRVQSFGVPIYRSDQDVEFRRLETLVRESDVIIDALLGTGVTGALRGDLRDMLTAIHRHIKAIPLQPESATPLRWLGHFDTPKPKSRRPIIVALDVPSGLNCDTGEIDALALAADLTVTIAYPKRGLFLYPGAGYVGELVVADIGTSPEFADAIPVDLATPESVAQMLPARPSDAHKGTFGKVLIVAGSTNYTGAPCLAAEAAYRSGAGLVTLAIAQAIYPVVASKLTEATFLVLPDDMGVLVSAAWRVLSEQVENYEALLVGPGLGRENVTGEFVLTLLGEEKRVGKSIGFHALSAQPARHLKLPPLVLDADALNLLAAHSGWWEYLPAGTILTPHPGEMARLLGCDIQTIKADRIGTALNAAQKWNCNVVLKGAYTVVAAPDGRASVIPFANPALATAGTGDVLAGTIAGLIAQGLPNYEAAVCGAYLHGLAGELGRKQLGQAGMLAGDLLRLLPLAIEQLRPSSTK